MIKINLLCVVIASSYAVAVAQTTGSVAGVVTDSSGARAPGATVTLQSAAGGLNADTSTDSSGAFEFRNLTMGEYKLTCALPGFVPVSQKILIDTARQVRLEVSLSPNTLRQSVTVSESAEEDYHAATATSATRTDTPLMDIPQSIEVVNRAVLQDQQITRIAEAANNVSGVTRAIGYSDSADSYTIRGFLVDYSLKNGFKNNSLLTLSEVANVERVEILKGPAAILYGRIEPGGVVNVVTRRPLSDWHFTVQSTFDNLGSARPSVDITGPLNANKTLLWRLTGSFDHEDSHREFVNSNTAFLSPAFTWVIGKRTVLSLEGEYLQLRGLPDAGLPFDPVSFTLPISFSLGEPSNRYQDRNDRGSYFLTHQFNDRWTLSTGFSWLSATARRNQVLAQPEMCFNGTCLPVVQNSIAGRIYDNRAQDSQSYFARQDLVGKFKTGAIEHTFLFGLELSKENYSDAECKLPVQGISLQRPIYGLTFPAVCPPTNSGQEANSGAAYVQDQITINRHWKLLAGARYDLADTLRFQASMNGGTGTTGGSGGASGSGGSGGSGGVSGGPGTGSGGLPSSSATNLQQHLTAFSPRAGVVFQPTSVVSLYFSFSKSFDPLGLNAFTPGVLSPTHARQYESGIKLDVLRNRLQTTVSVFRIEKEGLVLLDTQNGTQKSRGVEADITAQITRRWTATAAYSFDQVSLFSGVSANQVPVIAPNAPRHSGNLWTVYQIDKGLVRGLSVGAGSRYVADRRGNAISSLMLPSYTTFDAMAAYRFREGHWKLQGNVKDLGGRRYYETDGLAGIIFPVSRIVKMALLFQF